MFCRLSFAILFLALGHVTHGQIILPGKCPNVKLMSEFNLEAYTGVWYDYASYPFFFTFGSKCSHSRYGILDGNTVSVYNGAINRLTGLPNDISGYAKVLGPGSLSVVFFNGQSETKPNYNVLGTDYKTYAVVFACEKVLFTSAQYVWILTRDRYPQAQTVAAAMKVIKDNGLSQAYLRRDDQGGCPALLS